MELPQNYVKMNSYQRRIVRQEYQMRQDGKCYYCKSDLSEKPPFFVTKKKIYWNKFPEGFLNNPIHLHHCHKTGMTIGAVHAYCNAVLWQYHGE